MTQWHVIQTLHVFNTFMRDAHLVSSSIMYVYKESFYSTGHCLVEWLDNFHVSCSVCCKEKCFLILEQLFESSQTKIFFRKLGMKLVILKVLCAEQYDTKTCATGSDKIRDRSLLFGVEYKSSMVKKISDAI